MKINIATIGQLNSGWIDIIGIAAFSMQAVLISTFVILLIRTELKSLKNTIIAGIHFGETLAVKPFPKTTLKADLRYDIYRYNEYFTEADGKAFAEELA
jgi:hypothetical protein